MTSQRHTLEVFTGLRLLQPSWAGTLLLGIGLGETGRALAIASLAAGAAALFLESDPEQQRIAQREGCCTFCVTTLDEALRTLKNEVRQGHAISVALHGDAAAWLREMVERGVQPEFLAHCNPGDPASGTATEPLRMRGARTLCGFGMESAPGGIDLQQLVHAAADEVWHICEDIAPNLGERRARDASMLAGIPVEAPFAALSRQWMRAVPSLFPRAVERAFWTEKPTA